MVVHCSLTRPPSRTCGSSAAEAQGSGDWERRVVDGDGYGDDGCDFDDDYDDDDDDGDDDDDDDDDAADYGDDDDDGDSDYYDDGH